MTVFELSNNGNYRHLKHLAQKRSMVLGSGSPRRIELLRDLGLSFRQATPDIDETFLPGENPFEHAIRLAEDKARTVARQASESEVIIGGDTVVVLDEGILGKPESRDEAIRTLQTLSGREHVVGTALALASVDDHLLSGIEKTIVRFNKVPLEAIEQYVDSGEPMDKAGAYGIQGMGAFLVDSLEGNLDNVIGLPRSLLDRLAREYWSLVHTNRT